ncbi:hypothetical protein [Cupriavidus campinensis]|uniref:hypothetical protein n=1 Tax=Cupriavidus campinensis TaxID=151783 RepID=UPI0011EDC642|nr:hypothetical protein [Cupriavidus campinensis]
MTIEAAPCPLCATSASRRRLAQGDGYLYDCVACGGLYEIGTGALARAERGELHPDVIQGVRRMLAQGQRPRVEWDGPTGHFVVRAV